MHILDDESSGYCFIILTNTTYLALVICSNLKYEKSNNKSVASKESVPHMAAASSRTRVLCVHMCSSCA